MVSHQGRIQGLADLYGITLSTGEAAYIQGLLSGDLLQLLQEEPDTDALIDYMYPELEED